MAPPKPSGNRKIWLIVIFVICLPCTLLGFFVFRMMKEGLKLVSQEMMPYISCGMSTEAARDALREYARERGKLPPADKWMDEIFPYYDKKVKAQLSDGDLKELKGEVLGEKIEFKLWEKGDPTTCYNRKGEATVIKFNDALAGKKLEEIKNPTETVMLFESDGSGQNAHGVYDAKAQMKVTPKLMGKARKLVIGHVEGDIVMENETSKVKIQLESGVRKAREAEAEKNR